MICRIIFFTLFLPFLSGQQFYYPTDNNIDNETFYLPAVGDRSVSEQVRILKEVPRGITNLTLDIENYLVHLTKNEYDSHVYSPASISVALAMVLMASNGRTYNEILHVLGLTNKTPIIKIHETFGELIHHLEAPLNDASAVHKIKFANAIFLQNNFPIRREYQEAAASTYGSEVISVDFQNKPTDAQDTINKWVSEKTEGKIQKLLADGPDPSIELVLASALYFKAKWATGFYEETTRRAPFYTNGYGDESSKIMIDQMSTAGKFPVYNDSILHCDIVGLPYEGGKTTMYLIKPHNSNKQKLKELESKLTTLEIERLVKSTKFYNIVISMPKMKIEQTYDLKNILSSIGLNALFKPYANLALISKGTSPLIFSRLGEDSEHNCTQIFDAKTNITSCQEIVGNQTVTYKKIGSRIGRRITRQILEKQQALENIRTILNQNEDPERNENPGLFIDKAIHKVFIDITEYGTEAAAATAFSSVRSTSGVYRFEVPFLFFIMDNQSRTILFWGSIHKPTPNY